jgi:hypothetical protein
MGVDQFSQRIDVIRKRFASRLAVTLTEVDPDSSSLAGDGADLTKVTSTYRRIHDVCGTGPTIGFTASGQAARTIDAVLIGPFRAQRGLTVAEVAELKSGLDALRLAAEVDMQSTNTDRE